MNQIITSSNFEAPRLIRCELGIINFISFTNFFKRELGSREVVTHTLGSSIPAVAYSSSTCVYYLRIIKKQNLPLIPLFYHLPYLQYVLTSLLHFVIQ